ncbi:hypothetical protein ACU19_04995 [Actinobaculum suis]|uniref:hypothetical protein n=1 Tax=Actinobaculum suis TaxID=1657 RepID=UPI00066FD6A4|nr:hypothetical protein [Actinobaculum suis]KMY23330.1 hypothetical protein ACU19_04995 [Actinobaculum suis]
MELVITATTWKIEDENGETFVQGTFEPEIDFNSEDWDFFDNVTERVGEMSDLELENLGEGAYVSDDAKTMSWKVRVIIEHYCVEIDGETWTVTDKYGNTLETGDLDPEIDIPGVGIDIFAEKFDVEAVTEQIAQLSGMKLVAASYAGAYFTPFDPVLAWQAVEEI